jgi:CubicO group peptidase (beta-lactamase class C family)
VEDGRLDLDTPAFRYLDGWPPEGPRSATTLRHLLTHMAGLPPGLPANRGGSTRDAWIHEIAETPLRSEPGDEQVYSDLGPLLAAWIVESVTGEPFQAFVERRIYGPLGLGSTLFRPLDAGVPAVQIAPTEVLPEGHLRGTVHDPTARALGGVAGSAGLFSSASDLATLASALLWERPARVVCRDVLRAFTHRAAVDARFSIGWEVPAPWTVSGELPSASAFGHTGYTGTSLWIDPERDLFVILLTSRLNPTSANEEHVALRQELHGVVGRGYTGLPEEDDWRVPEIWHGVDSCRADEGFGAVAKLNASALGALAGW